MGAFQAVKTDQETLPKSSATLTRATHHEVHICYSLAGLDTQHRDVMQAILQDAHWKTYVSCGSLLQPKPSIAPLGALMSYFTTRTWILGSVTWPMTEQQTVFQPVVGEPRGVTGTLHSGWKRTVRSGNSQGYSHCIAHGHADGVSTFIWLSS